MERSKTSVRVSHGTDYQVGEVLALYPLFEY